MKFDIKSLLPHIIAIVLFISLSSIYFLPQFQGKVLKQTDLLQFQGMASEVIEYREQGENILWTNAMFSGMPAYQISAPQKKNISRYLERGLQLMFSRPVGYFICGMLAFYIALILLGVNPWIAMLGGIAFAFTPNNLVLYEAGHASKVRVLMVSIFVISGMVQIFRKKYYTGGLLYTVGMAISIYCNHFQMTYYLGLILGIYALIASINFILQKDYKNLITAIIILLGGSIIAIGSSASKIWTTYEYSKDTMRGKPILEKTSDKVDENSSSETEGLAWNYAMNWSNGLIDVMAMYIPGVAGGGSNEPIAKNSHTNKFMKKNRLRPIEFAPLYWGKLPFTSGPQYIGAISILLFIVSLFVVNPKIRWWAIIAFLLTAFMSMGKNMEMFNRLLFDNLPFLNKFRSPSSITSITALLVAFVAFLGINKLLTKKWSEEKRKELTKYVLITTGALAAICIYYIIIGPAITDFETAGDARYAENKGLANAFPMDRKALMRSDSIRTLIFTLLAGSSLFFFLRGKLKSYYCIGIIGVLLLFDLWGVDKRYINYDSFVKERTVKTSLQERPVDIDINKDKDPHFRVHDITLPQGPYNSTTASLHNKTIGGYHAAKLQRYQDIIDGYLMKGDQGVLNMLNTKYFIVGSAGQEQVRKNPESFGNAWFANDVVRVNTNREEFNKLATTNLKTTAIIHTEFDLPNYIPNPAASNGTIKLTQYSPDKLTYQSSNSVDALAVFSEIWYGPDKGWNAYIDGNKIPLIRANYLLRSIQVPAGNHEIILEFHPKAYYTGELVSFFCSIIILGGLIFAGFKYVKNQKTEEA